MELDKDRNALVVLDLQHDIVSPEGKFGSHGLGEQVAAAGAIAAAANAWTPPGGRERRSSTSAWPSPTGSP